MKVKEIMSKNVKLIHPHAHIAEAAKLMREKDIGMIPVGENDRLEGVITDRDIVIRALANGKDLERLTIREVMTPNCHSCFEEDTIEEASKHMSKDQIRRLTVLDKNKHVVGILSLGDVATKGSDEEAAKALHRISKTKH
ncbi:MAG: CBS protein [uncultured bacterium]|nr:MAG: CBS protein [uncultured bacterium]OFW68437.1 MAG: hypothetical protein A2X70_07050 [Alphaproteobacteria bacterium GWC2_42_16]OFW72969.1 MAG: hypothetical protein A2Z80_02810 [Alphaproteobacteria bacterium GWA2_41_27]OFW81529.1 MAG: hypothetical protein A3E50_05175 [Alphaproteobacteria bacterium RIFCSPHIGHO2_12_FULL_42_100]OFW86781.1 MAG: hypothetical protein A2W06_06095 [Alphaproteobacteria bacterium RBG_16_42_14]OFW90455.1 MAG: hypothetical protein A3C41_05970 [Alphaproteobacteria bac